MGITIFSGIDERVDAAVGDHEYHCEVVEPADENDGQDYPLPLHEYHCEVVEPADENDKLIETSDVSNAICKTKTKTTFPETFATTKRQTTEQHHNVN